MSAVRLARVLCLVWAVLTWNVVFDHMIVVAGRRYIAAARGAAASGAPFANMDAFMRPAVTRGVWIATASAAAILLLALFASRPSAAIAVQPEAR